MALREELAVSNGAACTSDRYGSSHVLEAMGLEAERIASAIRISWGPGVGAIPTDVLRDAVLQLR
jgi:cysteine desulfurase